MTLGFSPPQAHLPPPPPSPQKEERVREKERKRKKSHIRLVLSQLTVGTHRSQIHPHHSNCCRNPCKVLNKTGVKKKKKKKGGGGWGGGKQKQKDTVLWSVDRSRGWTIQRERRRKRARPPQEVTQLTERATNESQQGHRLTFPKSPC